MANHWPQYRHPLTVQAAPIIGMTVEDSQRRLLVVSVPGGAEAFAPTVPELAETAKMGDFAVIYGDDYRTVMSQEAFAKRFTRVGAEPDRHDIGWAVKELHDGRRVQRAGWNGKGMFLFLVPGSRFKVNRAPLLGIYPEGTEIDYHAHVDMRTATGEIVPWLCSQSDLLATDWQLAE